MELYLVRHPETIAPKGTCYGHTDYPLKYPVTETAQGTIEHLPNEFDHWISSPAPRALKLTSALLDLYGLSNLSMQKFETDERILEMFFGDWEGKLWDELSKKETLPWMKDFVHRKTPNGEAFTDLIKRTEEFLMDWSPSGKLNLKWREENRRDLSRMIVVCHAGPIRAILCLKYGKPFEEAFKEPLEFGSVHKLVI